MPTHMNIYDLPLYTEVWDIEKKMKGKITKIHPPKDYHYRWYTVTLENNKNRRMYTWNIPTYFTILRKGIT